MFNEDECFNISCKCTHNIISRDFRWLQTDKIKDGGGRRWKTLQIPLCNRCFAFVEPEFKDWRLEGWDEWDAVDGLRFEEDIYDFYFFNAQLFDDVNIMFDSPEASQLGRENISEICQWYNRNKIYDKIKYECDNNGFMIAKVDKTLVDHTPKSIVDFDQEGNYLLNGYYVSGSFII